MRPTDVVGLGPQMIPMGLKRIGISPRGSSGQTSTWALGRRGEIRAGNKAHHE